MPLRVKTVLNAGSWQRTSFLEGRGQRQRGAQQGEQGQRGQRGRQGQTSPLMRMFDADGDGVVSSEEMSNAGAVLLKMDKDGNGSLSAEELRPEGGRGGRGKGQGGQRGQGQRGEVMAVAKANAHRKTDRVVAVAQVATPNLRIK